MIPEFPLIVAASKCEIGLNGCRHAVGDHVGGGELGEDVGRQDAAAPSLRNPGFERQIMVADLELTETSTVLVRIDQARHEQAIEEFDPLGIGLRRFDVRERPDRGYCVSLDQHRGIANQGRLRRTGQDEVWNKYH